jgi:hypothetical protein
MRILAGLWDFKVPFTLRTGNVVINKENNENNESLRYVSELFKMYIGVVVPKGTKINIDTFIYKGSESEPDEKGYFMVKDEFRRNTKTQAWARKFDPFLMIATDRSLLEDVSSKMRIEKAERPAQIRMALGDFGGTDIGKILKAYLYARDRQVSSGGALQLQAVQQQLRPRDILFALEEMQGRKVLCPLGGKYIQDPAQPALWKSTAWQEPALYLVNQVPKDYSHPLLDDTKWLRLDFAIDQDTLSTRLDIQTKYPVK